MANNGHPQAAQPNPAWQQPQAQYPQQQQPSQHWAPQAAHPGYAPQGYGQGFPSPADYGHQKQQPSYGGLSPNPDAYAPSFEPYSPVSNPRTAPPAHSANAQGYAAPEYGAHAGYGAQDAYQQAQFGHPQHAQQPQPHANQWPGSALPDQHAVAGRGFEAANYLQQPATGGHQAYRADPRQHDSEPAFADWSQSQPQAPHGYDYGDAAGHHGQQHGAHDDMGFAQPAGGELEQGYAEDDGEEYEYEEPARGRRPLMIAAALAGAIFVGGGMAYGYKAFLGGSGTGTPPMVKSASEPSKIKPADAGGKQFDHADSKIMGRLGDGSASAAAELDANGSRKVSTLVVGRDGSIQAPTATPADAAAPNNASDNVAVPGMMIVDALGTHNNSSASADANATPPAPQKLVVTPPVAPQKPVTIAKANTAPSQIDLPDATGSIASDTAAPEPTAKPVVKKIAAAKTEVVNDAASAYAPVTAPTGANGYVAVLASVPRSDSSRMTALKRFADMQQKYGSVLNGKTPDVAEANLGAKGAYHRLVVGPPASRQQASTLCSELKAQGYADCWVTAY